MKMKKRVEEIEEGDQIEVHKNQFRTVGKILSKKSIYDSYKKVFQIFGKDEEFLTVCYSTAQLFVKKHSKKSHLMDVNGGAMPGEFNSN